MGVLRATVISLRLEPLAFQAARGVANPSETVVGESLVGLGHAVDFFLLFHGAAAALGRFHELVGKALRHALLATFARRLADPAHRQRRAANRTDFDRYLVVRAADAPALHLDHRLHVVDRGVEYLEGVLARLLGDG